MSPEFELSKSANGEFLDELFRNRTIDIVRGSLFDEPPTPFHVDFGKIEGMLLGLAIGDALGNTTESSSPSRRLTAHGEIRDYLPNRHVYGRRIGLPSDDTQLAFWTLKQLIVDKGTVPSNIAQCFLENRIFGIGETVAEFVARHQDGLPWYLCGVKSAGNGALMRIAPILTPHLKSPTSDLWTDTALCAMITHNDAGSIAACLAFVRTLWLLLQMDTTPSSDWWLDQYATVADLEAGHTYRCRTPHLPNFQGSISQFVAEHVAAAYSDGESTLDACNRWYSGAYLLETVPCALYILMRHADDPEEAIVRAVNDTRDNDTIASIVGAAVGALHGRDALPPRWIDGLSGRTTASDDGEVFRLITATKRTFCP